MGSNYSYCIILYSLLAFRLATFFPESSKIVENTEKMAGLVSDISNSGCSNSL